jgi:hypothetical protein
VVARAKVSAWTKLDDTGQVFAKLKHLLRTTAERLLAATWKHIGVLLNCFLPHECQAYLENAEYGSTYSSRLNGCRIVAELVERRDSSSGFLKVKT